MKPDTLLAQASELLPHSPSPRVDVEALLMHITGLSRSQLITQGQQDLSPAQQQQLQQLLQRRQQGEPIAYLTGEREFWSMPLMLTDAALIPRPETELLVEQALARIPKGASWRIADLGTGSGAIALALAQERPHCHLIASDNSAAALSVARANAERLGIENITFLLGDWFAPFNTAPLDMIVSNPPYIPTNDPHLEQGDVRFEPRSALVAGTDGLQAIQSITSQASRYLRKAGWLLLEHGYDQSASVAALLQQHGYQNIHGYSDLGGHERLSACQMN